MKYSLAEISEHNRKRAAFLVLKHEQLHLGKANRHQKAMIGIKLQRIGDKLVEQEYQKHYAHLEEMAWAMVSEFDEKVLGDQAWRNRKRFMRLLNEELDECKTFINLPDEWLAMYGAFLLATTKEQYRDYSKQWKERIWGRLQFSYDWELKDKLMLDFGIGRKNTINPKWWEIISQELANEKV